tara:strand:+ start:124 stop:282 length:159 start_codon:yes stop_codon:yes gene_type:complete
MDDFLASCCANKNINYYFYTGDAVMIGWIIGQVIFWVGLIVVASWILRSCGL